MTQGYQALPSRSRSASRSTTTCSRSRPGRVACGVQAGSTTASRCRPSIAVWPTADWHEREAWDMMGIPIEGHPNLKRILHGRRLGGPPAAQGLPDRRRAGPLLGGGVVARTGGTRAPIYEGTRIPSPIPTCSVAEELRRPATC
jgi:hypothetical protein